MMAGAAATFMQVEPASATGAFGKRPCASPAGPRHVSQTLACRPLQVEIARTPAEFARLEQDWNDLFERSGRSHHVFQQFGWLGHGLNNAAPDAHPARLCIVTVRLAGQLVLIWPLEIVSRAGLRQLQWFGAPYGQYGDVLIAEKVDRAAILGAAWRQILCEIRPDLCLLRRVRADANVGAFLDTVGAIVVDRSLAASIDLQKAPTFEEYLETKLSRHARKELRRLRRRLGEYGEVRSETVHEPVLASQIARQSIELKRRWLADRGLASRTLACRRATDYFANIALGDVASGKTVVRALWSGEQLAGAQVAFACKGRLALHVIAYNLEHQRAGVGKLHLADTIEWAYGNGFSEVDLLAPSADYKLDWATDTTTVEDLAVPISIAGHLYTSAYLAHVRPGLKRVVPYLPKPIRKWAEV